MNEVDDERRLNKADELDLKGISGQDPVEP
jgi:hypothetical protein